MTTGLGEYRRASAAGIAVMAILLAGAAAAQPAQTPDTPQQAPQPVTQLPPVEVIGASPLIGSGIDRNRSRRKPTC